ncbi:preprotein translocase G [Aeromonas schubertii]|uniref:YscG family type III secretion system chaperone n=1 Tax=Aeromonas schubertii TaxID=652 RepID=UPI00067F1138|nr:YscG family type III secretion system chaperone [Aeromonas schubertii]KUE80862.1 preprotein translocase G [Aeromonas schubertii]
MMEPTLKGLLAEIALAGTGHHCHEEAAHIADWLQLVDAKEAATLVRVSSLMNRGKYQDASQLAAGSPELEPWQALCEYRLGHSAALAQRLERMELENNPALREFVRGMKEQMRS